ncbi:SDR family NAD(P)-dependent oxidoreductase [Streptomyces albipurpureus]|uniref:SDR family oxidoreductase n=1 Tax=Streptomyces albipurpureus TaxID=2897419 RepID=A0ABT0UYS2_9ACTN|nr:SDR family oxidoreductase [Streptomyces sp. CWNU-1]MCM2393727.1 SDR family oxidoreductase [Streptomyces sp. CWNU-1]
MDIRERVVIVTGAASGIGADTARLLARRGARIVVTDISEEGARITEEIRGSGGEAEFIRADIGVEAEAEALVAKTLERYGRLDGAFNNAGVEQCATPLHELTSEQWERAIRVDLTGVFHCLKHQIAAMLEAGTGGSIVNTASALGQVAIPNASEYVAAKHGVIGLTRAAAADYGRHGIRVNAVLPGIVETTMVARLSGDPTFSAYFDTLRQRHVLGRFGQPGEIGESVAWLLSDSASFVTGAAISVDGGYLAI